MPRVAEATQQTLCSWFPWVLSLLRQPPAPCESLDLYVGEFIPHVIMVY